MTRIDDLAREYRDAYRNTNKAGAWMRRPGHKATDDEVRAFNDALAQQNLARVHLFDALDARDALDRLRNNRKGGKP